MSKYFVIVPPSLEVAMREFLANEPGGASVEVIVQSRVPETPQHALLRDAKTIAEWHVMDGDECGVIARRLLAALPESE